MPATQTIETTPATLTADAFFAVYDAAPSNDIIPLLKPLFDGSVGVRGADDGYTCQCTIYHFTPQV